MAQTTLADTFTYIRLVDATRQIRLLSYRETRPDGTLVFSIATKDRHTGPPFKAISYEWGNVSNDQTVIVSGQPKTIRRNCYYALWQFILHYGSDLVWIDSICINQDDAEEKSKQVSTMGELYTMASLVLACIGEHDEASIEMFKVARSQPNLRRLEVSDVFDAFNAFASRTYWTRLWIVPEMINPRGRISILCGEDSISWWDLWETVHKIVRFRNHHMETHFSCIWRLKERAFRGTHDALSLKTIVRETHKFQCLDPRDRVFAFCEYFGVVPDYTMSSWELAAMASGQVSKYTNGAGDLDFLLKALEIDHGNEEVKRLLRQRRRERPASTTRRSATTPGKSEMKEIRKLFDGYSLPLRPTTTLRFQSTAPPSWFEHAETLCTVEHTSALPWPIKSGSDVIGFACNKARRDDCLWCFTETSRLKGVCLVLRKRSSLEYTIVGQALLIPEWLRAMRNTSFSSGIILYHGAKVMLSNQDLLLLFAQDSTGDDGTYDPKARAMRLITRVTEETS